VQGTTRNSVQRRAFTEDFDVFYSREFKSVAGLAFVLSGSRSGAEDLAQDAFLAACRDWERIASYDDPGAWVRRVVANRSVSMVRRRVAEAKALLRLRGQRAPVPAVDVDAASVWAEVRKLPRRQAQVVALRFLDQRSIPDIAVILSCSKNTVKTHLRRAVETLARRLGEEYRYED